MPSPFHLFLCALLHASASTGEGRAGSTPAAVVRIPTRFDKGVHGVGRFRLAQQYAVHAAAEDLAELPGIEADISGVGSVDRRLDNDCGRAVPRAGRTALDQPRHVFGEPGHVEGAVLHADIDVVGPNLGVFAPLRAGQHMAAVAAGVVDRLILSEQFDRAIDTLRPWFPLAAEGGVAVDRRAAAAIVAATSCGRGGMADAADSKSVASNGVEVQVLSPAPTKPIGWR